MLPRVRINYANGTLGQVAAMADGCLGMMALGAKEVTGDDKFKLGKAYTPVSYTHLTLPTTSRV